MRVLRPVVMFSLAASASVFTMACRTDTSARTSAGLFDVGAAPDGGASVDARTEAAGPEESGIPDATVTFDATTPDATVTPDGRTHDSGVDAPAEEAAGPIHASFLLRGVVLAPTGPFTGEVLVTGDTLACVDVSCASAPGAATATVIEANGVISPGLVDTHNHILFDIFDETDWTPSKAYSNHNQWTAEDRYGALVNAKQYLNGESGSPLDLGCEMDKYGELKGLIAGTTSIVGAANPDNRACYGSLARTIDQSPNGLPEDDVQVATLFPSKASGDGVCANFASNDTHAYLIHIAEGVDSTARAEFAKLQALTTTPDCLFAQPTTIVHGTALVAADFATMAGAAMSLTWSPRSNVFLYGGGTDLTKTTDIPSAMLAGLNISLAPDWSIGGSQNLLDELRFARQVDQTEWHGSLSSQALFEMVTKNPAKALALSGTIGGLTVGARADVVIFGGDATAPYDAVLAATPAEVRLVMVDGVPLYGDTAFASLAPVPPGAAPCEMIDICGTPKFVCVSRPSAHAGDKLDQTYAQISSALTQALLDYDAMGLTAYAFSPVTPLVRCGP